VWPGSVLNQTRFHALARRSEFTPKVMAPKSQMGPPLSFKSLRILYRVDYTIWRLPILKTFKRLSARVEGPLDGAQQAGVGAHPDTSSFASGAHTRTSHKLHDQNSFAMGQSKEGGLAGNHAPLEIRIRREHSRSCLKFSLVGIGNVPKGGPAEKRLNGFIPCGVVAVRKPDCQCTKKKKLEHVMN
jgi:hypothetical protein